MPSFIITFYAIFDCYSWKACEEEWNMRKEDVEGRDWEKRKGKFRSRSNTGEKNKNKCIL